MASYKELLQQREALNQQIAEAKRLESQDAIKQARALVAEFGLTEADVFGVKRNKGGAEKVKPKYRDHATGKTWSGRGKPPAWLAGQDRLKFVIV